MVDLTSLLNAMKTTSSPSQTGGSQVADGIAKDPQSTFAAILKANVAGKTSAQSGNPMPASGNSVPDNIAADSQAALDNQGSKENNLLENRTLKSGLKLLVSGDEPTEQAISEFAALQGIDSDAIKLLMDKDISQHALNPNALNPSNGDKKSQGLSSTVDPANLETAKSPLGVQGIHNLASITNGQQPSTQGALSVTASLDAKSEHNLANQTKGTTSITATAVKQGLEQNSSSNKKLGKTGIDANQLLNASKSGQTTGTSDSLTASQKALLATINKSIQSGDAKLAEAPMQQTSALKLMLKVSEGELRKMPHKEPNRQAPAVKLAPINLLAAQPNAPISVAEAEHTALQLSAADATDRGPSQELKESQTQDVMRRRDQYSELSRRLSEALGQRISAQVARGEWRVEMELHPRSLGRIEIQLEMKNGDLEANFYTANSATKDLINDSLPRLRLALEQYGMESAYKGLEQGNNGKSDGNPTQHQDREDQLAKGQSPEAEPPKQAKLKPDDGLDILI